MSPRCWPQPGKGSRLGAPIPKAFVSLRGVSLVERSIRGMVTSDVVDQIIVLVSPDMEDYARELFAKRGVFKLGVGIRLVHGGGGTRCTVCGLVCRPLKKTMASCRIRRRDARALAPPGLIARVAQSVLAGNAAVIPVLPVADTIKRVAEGAVVDTPPRDTLRAVQTPQGFDLRTLRAANQEFFAQSHPSFTPTDDASLMEWYGQRVLCVPGDPHGLSKGHHTDGYGHGATHHRRR